MIKRTPAAWLETLSAQLDAQAKQVRRYKQYYDGNHRLTFATQKFRQAFGRYMSPMADNWMQVVVDAAVERIEVQGFRFGTPDPSKQAWELEADTEAWNIWQQNDMDSQAIMAHTEAVKCGKAFALVWPKEDGETPQITVEDPSQVAVARNPANRRERYAAIKRWLDDDGYVYAYIYLPDSLVKYRTVDKVRGSILTARLSYRQLSTEPNPLGIVPMVPIENRPDLLRGGTSDLETAIPLQDAINKHCLDMIVSSEFHAFVQRYVTGWEVDRDENGAVPTDAQLKASMSTIWAFEDKDTKVGQLTPGSVENYIKPIETYVDHLATQTRTPGYYLKGSMTNLSAEALIAAERGLVFRVKRKLIDFSGGWEEVMRLAFTVKKDQTRSNDTSVETMWVDPQHKSIGQLVDAAVKLHSELNVPYEVCWMLVGMTPQQVRQIRDFQNLPASGPKAGSNTPAPAATDPASVE